MAFHVVLDANVLLPAPLRDTLLRLAEADLYVPRWSERILTELSRNLVKSGRTDAKGAMRIIETIGAAFPEATVPSPLVEALEPVMTNDPKDRHVLAAAVACGAQVIITKNLKDFPTDACLPLGTEAINPDDFLIDLHRIDPSLVTRVLVEQAAALNNPPMAPSMVLDKLSQDAPTFAGRIQRLVG